MTAIRNCPTCRQSVEEGFPKLQSPFWLAVVAPAGTPPDVIAKLNDAFRQALAAPETRARLEALGAESKIGTPEDLDKMLAAERAQWTAVVQGGPHQDGMTTGRPDPGSCCPRRVLAH